MRAYLAQAARRGRNLHQAGLRRQRSDGSEKHPNITFSAYVPPSAKKKRKVERTRFRETTHYRQKSGSAAAATTQAASPRPRRRLPAEVRMRRTTRRSGICETRQEGKDPLRQGSAEDLAACTLEPDRRRRCVPPQVAANAEPDNPLESTPKPEKKTRYSDRAKLPKQPKPKGPQLDPLTPAPPDAAEVADRQTQAGPLGLGGERDEQRRKRRPPRPATRPA